MRRHILGLIIGVFTFISAIVLSPMVSYQIGKLEARHDFLHGKRQLKWCGGGNISRELTRELKSILRSEFGVETMLPSSCAPDMINAWRIRGYNDQQSKELEMIYGRNVVEGTVAKVILCDMVKNHAERALPDFDH